MLVFVNFKKYFIVLTKLEIKKSDFFNNFNKRLKMGYF